jgi:hypothetical protein
MHRESTPVRACAAALTPLQNSLQLAALASLAADQEPRGSAAGGKGGGERRGEGGGGGAAAQLQLAAARAFQVRSPPSARTL